MPALRTSSTSGYWASISAVVMLSGPRVSSTLTSGCVPRNPQLVVDDACGGRKAVRLSGNADPYIAAAEEKRIAVGDLLIVVEALDAQVLGLRRIEATHVGRAVEADGLKPDGNPEGVAGRGHRVVVGPLRGGRQSRERRHREQQD